VVCAVLSPDLKTVWTNTFYTGTTFDYATAAAAANEVTVLIGVWVGTFVLAGSQRL
jgi:hypothetical protein